MHKYHFVLNHKMKEEIILFSKKIDKSISKTIIYIIKLLYPILENYQYFYNEDQSYGYKIINADEEVYIYMDRLDYRKIKFITRNMFVFSTAIIIRKIIQSFLSGLGKYGFEKFLKLIQRYNNLYFFKLLRLKKWKKNLCKHLQINTTRIEKYRFTYTNNYTLIGIDLLNFTF